MPDVVNGIVLHSINYKETSLIVKAYTKQHGLTSILVNGVRKRGAKYSMAYFQPLVRIDFQLYFKATSTLHRADGFYFPGHVQTIAEEMGKSAIAMFVAEVVLRTTKEGEMDIELFELLDHVIQLLNLSKKGVQDIHLYFLYLYSTIQGFSLEQFHRMEELGIQEVVHRHLGKMSQWTSVGYHPLEIAREDRAAIVKWMLHYFEEHVGAFSIKSLKILEDVFQG